jgi:hypothetical protein
MGVIPMRFQTADRNWYPTGEIGISVGADPRVCPLYGRTRGCAPTLPRYVIERETVSELGAERVW